MQGPVGEKELSEPSGGAHPFSCALIALLAALFVLANLQVMPGADQGLFVLSAQRLDGPATFYRDIWDVKQPGIYWFYEAANGLHEAVRALPGSAWSGVVLLYALWIGATTVLAALVVQRAWPGFRQWWLVLASTAAITALRMDPNHYAEIEGLVNLPLLAIVWLGLGASGRRAFVAGLLSSLVLCFKLVLAPVAGFVFAAMLAHTLFCRELSAARALRGCLAYAIGCCCGALPMLIALWLSGTLDVFLWTTFQYPLQALGDIPLAPVARLVGSLKWLGLGVGLGLPSCAIASMFAIRAPRSSHARAVVGLVAWLLGGFAMIVVQKFSWWGYHMELLLWPIGVLAVLGVAAMRGRWRVAGTVLLLLGVALNLGWALKKRISDPDWPEPLRNRKAIDEATMIVTTVGPSALPCRSGYVFGDQRLMAATGLRQDIPEIGMNWFSLPAKLHARLIPRLEAARPDLLHLDILHREHFARRYPEVLAWIAANYRVVQRDARDGEWMLRREANQPGQCPSAQRFTVPG